MFFYHLVIVLNKLFCFKNATRSITPYNEIHSNFGFNYFIEISKGLRQLIIATYKIEYLYSNIFIFARFARGTIAIARTD